MAVSNNTDSVDGFLSARGHDVEAAGWDENGAKRQCPECGGLAGEDATRCRACGWDPRALQ